MKQLKNERGYTLVLVLLMITLVFSFSAVLIGKNINFSRQVASTEKYYRPIALAEMGVTFARKAISQTLTDVTPELVTKHTKNSFNQEEFLDDVASTVAQAVTDDGDRIVEGESGFHSSVKGERQEDNSILFTIESTGEDENGTYLITVQLVAENEGTLESSGDGSGDNSGSGDSDNSSIDYFETLEQFTEKEIDFPTNLTYDDSLSNDTNYTEDTTVTNSTKYDKININSSGITLNFGEDIYINNDLNLNNNAATINAYGNISTGNINNATGSVLNVRGYAEFRNGLNLQSMALQVDENVKINGSVKIDTMNSVTIGGELNSENTVEVSNSSDVTFGGFTRMNGLTMSNAKIVIKDNFHSKGNLSIGSNSTLIVHGSMNINNFSVAPGSELIVYGNGIFSDNISGNAGGGKVIIYGSISATGNASNQLNNIINNGTLLYVDSLEDCVEDGHIYVLNGSVGNSPETDEDEGNENSGEISISNDWSIEIQDVEY